MQLMYLFPEGAEKKNWVKKKVITKENNNRFNFDCVLTHKKKICYKKREENKQKLKGKMSKKSK